MNDLVIKALYVFQSMLPSPWQIPNENQFSTKLGKPKAEQTFKKKLFTKLIKLIHDLQWDPSTQQNIESFGKCQFSLIVNSQNS